MNIEKEYVLEMKDITKHYGENTVLNGVSLSVKKGEIHALLGENGAGKSTLMNMLAGLLEPTSGEIVVNGQVVKLDSPSKPLVLELGWFTNILCWFEAFTVA